MTNTELLNFHFVDRTDERKLANDYISGSNNFILLVYGKSHAGKNFFIDKLEDENEKIFFLIFDFEQTKRKNALKYITDILYKNNNDKFMRFIKNNYKKILKTTNNIVEEILTISNADMANLFACLCDINCQFLDNSNYQESSIYVISKYLKELFKNDKAVVVFKNLTDCDEYYINPIFQILKTVQSFKNVQSRFIISLDEDKYNDNEILSMQLPNLPHIPIEIKKFEDSIYFTNILKNIFSISNKNRNYIEHLFKICDGYPGVLKQLLFKFYDKNYSLVKDKSIITLDKTTYNAIINSSNSSTIPEACNEFIKGKGIDKEYNYDLIILFPLVFIEYNFSFEQLTNIIEFVYHSIYINLPRTEIETRIRKLIYEKKLLMLKPFSDKTIVCCNNQYKEYIIPVCRKDDNYKLYTKYFYDYIKYNKELFQDNINSFYDNISYFSWESESPDRIEKNFEAGSYFYNINEYSMAENIFLRIYKYYDNLSSEQLFKICKCFYEFGNYGCALEIVENDKANLLSNEYEFIIIKIKILNICMKKSAAINQIDLAMHSNKFNNKKYELLDMKQRILSNIEGKRREAKIIYDDLYRDFNNGETNYNNFLISSMEYYRGEIVQNSFNLLIKECKQTKNQVMLAETLTNKGFDLFWQGKFDDAIKEFNDSINLLETLRIHEISYTLNNLANCFMIKGEYDEAINCLEKALFYNESKYVDIIVKNNLMVCYAIVNNSCYEKYFYELEEYLEQNKNTEIDISIILKVKYSLGLVQDFFYDQNESLKNKCDNYTAVAINIANEYDQNTLPYLWFKDWKQEIEEDIEHRLIGDEYISFKNFRFDPWLLTITHD